MSRSFFANYLTKYTHSSFVTAMYGCLSWVWSVPEVLPSNYACTMINNVLYFSAIYRESIVLCVVLCGRLCHWYAVWLTTFSCSRKCYLTEDTVGCRHCSSLHRLHLNCFRCYYGSMHTHSWLVHKYVTAITSRQSINGKYDFQRGPNCPNPINHGMFYVHSFL